MLLKNIKGGKSLLDVIRPQLGLTKRIGAGALLASWTCPYQTGHSAWLGDLLAMNSSGDLMRKPECGWMLL